MRNLLRRFATKVVQKQVSQLEKELADLQATIESKDRRIGILESEIEGLAEVLARDRARVAAEMAAYARRQAEAERKENYDDQGYLSSVG